MSAIAGMSQFPSRFEELPLITRRSRSPLPKVWKRCGRRRCSSRSGSRGSPRAHLPALLPIRATALPGAGRSTPRSRTAFDVGPCVGTRTYRPRKAVMTPAPSTTTAATSIATSARSVRVRSRRWCSLAVRYGRTLAAARARSIVLTRLTPLDPEVVAAGRLRYASCGAGSESVPTVGRRQAPKPTLRGVFSATGCLPPNAPRDPIA